MAAISGIVAQQPSPNGGIATSQRLERTASPVLCPVTALAFYQHRQRTPAEPASQLLLLAGEDGWLCVYGAAGTGSGVDDVDDVDDDEDEDAVSRTRSSGRHCYGRLRVFAEQAVQGCRVGDDDDNNNNNNNENENDNSNGSGSVLVWGGQSVAIVSRAHIAGILVAKRGTEASHPPVHEVKAADWIYDGLLPRRASLDSKGKRTAMGALITAHNEVLPFCIDTDSISGSLHFPCLSLVGAPISPSRPVLYSAQLAWAGNENSSDDDRLLVVAGTVFGEIVVWTCQLPVTSSTGPAIKVLDVFAGHEGSIFDVVVSPDFDVGDLSPTDDKERLQKRRRVRLLASCSDDRTIWVWPLYMDGRESTGSPDVTGGLQATSEARETGFQNTFEGLAQRTDEPTPSSSSSSSSSSTKPQPRSAIDKQYRQSNDLQAASKSSTSSSAALATVMAHASRIWHVRFGDVSAYVVKDGGVLLYSFGEDATAQEWRLELKSTTAQPQPEAASMAGQLVHLRTLSSHAGKNIWSAAVSAKTASRGPLVATGGCDGKICLFEGRKSALKPQRKEQEVPGLLSGTIASSTIPPKLTVAETKVPTPEAEEDDSTPNSKKPKQKKVRGEVFNSYAFLSDDQLLAASTDGRLLLGDLCQTSDETTALEWHELPNIPDTVTSSLRDYNVIRSPRGGGGGGVASSAGAEGLALLGTATGQLFVFSRAGGLQQLATKLPGKVDEIFFLPHTADDAPKAPDTVFHLCTIATTLFRDEAALLDLTIDLASGTLQSETSRLLKLPTKVPASPAAMVITAASRCLEYIVLGSRNGQLCLYKPVTGARTSIQPAFALETQLQTRTKDAILSIVPLPPRPGSPPLSSASFVVTARDGTYRIYSIDRKDAPVIRLQHETATPFGPIVRDAWFMASATPGEPPELVVCGFRSTSFVVWNETRQQELACVDCGGTHRTHTYLYCGSPAKTAEGRIRFAFTRQSELHVFAQDTCVTAPIKTGGHGREIRSIRSSASGRYLATGGEDTVVRIWDSSRPTPSLERRCLSVLKLHNTGLHSLAWLGDDCLISAAGSEELFIWRITTIPDSAYDGLAVLCESSYPDSTNDKILRIIGLDASPDPNDDDDDDEENNGKTTGAMLISVGLSNSIVKTYRYSTAGGWQLLAQGHYTGACPTQLHHLRLKRGGDLMVLAAFADGHLTLWRALLMSQDGSRPLRYGEYTLLCATRSHQNAIKALDLVQATVTGSFSSSLLFTGGDDNAIAVTALYETRDTGIPRFSFGKTFRVSRAHAAAVTGARILLHETNETGATNLTAVTCSNDQRLKIWRAIIPATREDLPVRIQLLDNRYSAIADPGDVESIGGTGKVSAIVVGMGMESWDFV